MTEEFFRVGDKPGYSPGIMPWEMIAPHEGQAVRNHSQSLHRLHDRGGLSWCEALCVLEDRAWRAEPKAREMVLRLIERWKADETARIEKGAIVLWHRFAPDSTIEWEWETHKAEYRDAVKAVMKVVLE